MLDQSMMPALRLLLACARVPKTREDKATIRQMLDKGVDWTVFARKAVEHGLAGLVGRTLVLIAPDLVPDDILDALRMNVDETRRKNRGLFDELARLLEALANKGIEAIPFKGPVLAIQAYGDLGLRVFRDLDFLIRDPDMSATLATLLGLGYKRNEVLTEAQIEMIQHLQGQDFVFSKTAGIGVEPHTRLTPIKMALDIDYSGLWGRAQRTTLNGATMLLLTPEDHLIILAIHGGKEFWWRISWACDVAAFVESHPKLHWIGIVERARAQGCLRMVLLATSLARKFFAADVPDAIIAAERADPIINAMVERIMVLWQAAEPVGPPSNKTLSMDRLRLHDGLVRRARYVARTLFLPGRHHVAWMPLPRRLGFAYVPIKIAHDVVMWPAWRAYRSVIVQRDCSHDSCERDVLALAMMPSTGELPPTFQRHEEARAEASRAIAAHPIDAAAWRNLGNALSGLGRHKDAIACYERAIALAPDNAASWRDCGIALVSIHQPKAALTYIEKALALDPQDAHAWTIRAGALSQSQRFAEAVTASDRALSLDTENVTATRVGIHSRLHACDWRRREDDKWRIAAGWKAGERLIRMVDQLGMCESEEESLIAARLWARDYPPSEKPFWRGERYSHGKIRVAYLSTDFRNHPVASSIVGCFEHHDKMRFETTGISLGPDDGSKLRWRIGNALDRFIDAQAKSNAEIAAILRELEIDIVVDLNGWAGDRRPGIVAHRPAPLQVNYLGYPGSMGVPSFDYIIADRIVIPGEHRIHYSEKVVYLPHTYLPNDRRRQIAEKTPSRAEAGLPEAAFVFVCFNNTRKIGPKVFDVWMRLLRDVDGSVLWLRAANSAAIDNLRREAQARGVAPERLVFAAKVPGADEHLARLRAADLFLDTLPYNAHATASDALWAGLPLLTCPGNTFPARVAASLLYAIGLPELVTSSLAEYEELARALARDPKRLAAVRAKLLCNRDVEPLFDTARFTRYLESAYATMWEQSQAGLPPESFSVAN